jgi:hypothetical protein
MAKKKATSGLGGSKPGQGAPPATPAETKKLHDFFRGLYQDPDKLDRFNSGPQGRQKVLDASNLSAAHKKVVKQGCIPDVIHALVGAPAITASYMLAIDCQDPVSCKHAHCLAFAGAMRAPAKKR